MPFRPTASHGVFPRLPEGRGREIGHDIRREVPCGIGDFVQQLFRDGFQIHDPATARRLGQGEAAILGDLDDRVADGFEVRRIVRVDPKSAGRLGAAFDEVPSRGPGTQPVPVVERPGEFVQARPDGEARIGDAARDDHTGPPPQRFGNRRGTEVRIRTDNPLSHTGQRFAGVEVVQRVPPGDQGIELRHQVVATDDPDAGRGEDLPGRESAGPWIHAPRVRDDLQMRLRPESRG